MKKLLFALLCIAGTACSSSKKVTGENIDGTWTLTVFPSADKTFTEIFGQRQPQLVFDQAKKTVTGTTGCNRLSGHYNATGTQLIFDSAIVTTKMACPGYEEVQFLEALHRVNRFERSKSELRLLNDSTLIMGFVKK